MNDQASPSGSDLSRGRQTEQLEAHIQCRLNGRVRNFRLFAQDQGLVLQGRSHTYYVKQLAQEMVMGATELPIMANKIEVS